MAGERALSQEAAALEAEVFATWKTKLENWKLGEMQITKDYLRKQSNWRVNSMKCLSREQILINRVKILENENFNLGDEFV